MFSCTSTLSTNGLVPPWLASNWTCLHTVSPRYLRLSLVRALWKWLSRFSTLSTSAWCTLNVYAQRWAHQRRTLFSEGYFNQLCLSETTLLSLRWTHFQRRLSSSASFTGVNCFSTVITGKRLFHGYDHSNFVHRFAHSGESSFSVHFSRPCSQFLVVADVRNCLDCGTTIFQIISIYCTCNTARCFMWPLATSRSAARSPAKIQFDYLVFAYRTFAFKMSCAKPRGWRTISSKLDSVFIPWLGNFGSMCRVTFGLQGTVGQVFLLHWSRKQNSISFRAWAFFFARRVAIGLQGR